MNKVVYNENQFDKSAKYLLREPQSMLAFLTFSCYNFKNILLVDADNNWSHDIWYLNGAGGTMEYKIQLLWDNEASVWVATSPNIPGLVLESGSFDALIERVRYAIPELLELNRQKAPFYNLTFLSERHERVVVNG